VTEDPVLVIPDWHKSFSINPSASEIAVATVLMQNDRAGRGHPVYYASRLLSTYELKYPPSEKLAVALIFTCTKFKHYLLASHFPVTVQCEQDCLKLLIQQTEPTGRIARFIAALQQYDLIFQKIGGQRALHARTLLELGVPPKTREGELSDEAECYVLSRSEDQADFGYQQIIGSLGL
jgi:hypothetical protein